MSKQPNPEQFSLHPHLTRAKKLAILLDASVQIPLTNKTIGLDPVLGIVPYGGDAVTALLSCYMFWIAYELKLPKRVYASMAANIVIDYLIGVVPWLGDIFDAAWKANVRNVTLLEKAYAKKLAEGASSTIIKTDATPQANQTTIDITPEIITE
jgi:hypothetical protein